MFSIILSGCFWELRGERFFIWIEAWFCSPHQDIPYLLVVVCTTDHHYFLLKPFACWSVSAYGFWIIADVEGERKKTRNCNMLKQGYQNMRAT